MNFGSQKPEIKEGFAVPDVSLIRKTEGVVISAEEKFIVKKSEADTSREEADRVRVLSLRQELTGAPSDKEKIEKDWETARAENALVDVDKKIAASSFSEARSLEKKKLSLEQISNKLESQRLKKDEDLMSRGFKTVNKGLEVFHKLNWKQKVALGLGLGAAGVAATASAAPLAITTVAAAGWMMRGAGARSTYLGMKERDISKENEERMVRGLTTGDWNEIDTVITENSINKKGMALTALTSVILPTAAQTEVGHGFLQTFMDKTTDFLFGSAHAGNLPTMNVGTVDGKAPGADFFNGQPGPQSLDLGHSSSGVSASAPSIPPAPITGTVINPFEVPKVGTPIDKVSGIISGTIIGKK